MLIAFSGAHAVGKSTLITEIHQRLVGYERVDEPYYELLEEGHSFADTPSVDDLVTQLERSIARLTSDRVANVLYERCPADFLAYLSTLDAHDSIREWLAPASNALRTLDLIVFVPVERPDRIADADGGDRLRRKVDVLLREILLENGYGFDRPVLTVHGSVAARVRQVVAAVQQHGVHVRSMNGRRDR